MTHINIYFEDLNEQAQQEMREALREEMEKLGELEGLSEQEKEEKIDDYINRNNFANEFEM